MIVIYHAHLITLFANEVCIYKDESSSSCCKYVCGNHKSRQRNKQYINLLSILRFCMSAKKGRSIQFRKGTIIKLSILFMIS